MLPLILTLALAPVAVLDRWDEQRAAAWATGDVAALRALYTPGSSAGRRDAAMLREWSARGLRVDGLRMQLIDVDVRRRTPDRLVLAVTDRLAGGVAEPGGLALPWDRPSRHVVTLRVVAGEWRVSAVAPAPPR
ncbi:hypothetical protein GCM10027062_01700 [Nocardioides hungaricus]